MELSAVILAGGESRRMGRDKAWIEFAGRPLVAHAVDTVRQLGVNQLFISGRVGEDYSALGCPVLFDLEPGLGPLGGIERALRAGASPLLLVLAVDLPHMTVACLQKLIARCGGRIGAVPKLDGRLEPLAAIYPKRCHGMVVDHLARARLAARDFAEACLQEGAVRAVSISATDSGCFANWNRPDDLPAPTATGSRPPARNATPR